jgi:hypothetical protein
MAGTSPAMTKRRVILRLLEEPKKSWTHFRSGAYESRYGILQIRGHMDAALALSHNFAGR